MRNMCKNHPKVEAKFPYPEPTHCNAACYLNDAVKTALRNKGFTLVQHNHSTAIAQTKHSNE